LTGIAHVGREEHRLLVHPVTHLPQDAYFDVNTNPIFGPDGKPSAS
jgi:hypothetical protein